MTMEETQRTKKFSKQEQIEDYEKLRQRIKNHFNDAMKGNGLAILVGYIDEISELYTRVQTQKVKDTKIHLEDSEVFKEVSDFAALSIRNHNFGDLGVSLDERGFLKCLKRYAVTDESLLTNDDVDLDNYQADDDEDDEDSVNDEHNFNKTNWLKLGILYHQVSKKPILVDFLNGPLKAEKRKIVRTRNIDDTKGKSSSTTARQVQASDISGNEEQNTANMVKMVYRTYIEKDDGEGVNLFKFFINPFSFGQSVENLFYSSFLIKDGRLKLYTDEHGIPCIERVTGQEIREAREEDHKMTTTHNIATFNYGAWRKYIELYDIRDAFLGHRNEPEDQMPPEDIIEDDENEVIPNSLKRKRTEDSDAESVTESITDIEFE